MANSPKIYRSARLFLKALLLFSCSLNAQFIKNWDKDFGGMGAGNNEVFTAMIATPDSGYLLGGGSNSDHSIHKASNCKGNFDFWIVKITAGGVKQWEKTFGGAKEDFLECISRTVDGGYLLGGSSASNVLAPDKTQNSFGSKDFWIIKIDANGNKQWDKTYGGLGSDELRSITLTSTGYILAGFSDSDISGKKTEKSKGGTDYWIVSIDTNGNILWDKTIGGNGDDFLLNSIPYSNGVLLCGYSYSNISSDKSQNSQGPEGNSDYWVVKITNGGAKIWDITLGGFGDETLSAAIQAPDGGAILAGHSFSAKNGDKTTDNFDPNLTGDFWVVKINENASKSAAIKGWDASFGGADHDLLYDISSTSDGNFLLAGASISPVSGNKTYVNKGGYDYWIVKMNVSGNKIWDSGYGGTNNDYLQKIVASSSSYLVGGHSQSGINGDKTQNTLGSTDYWILKLQQNSMFRMPANPQQAAQAEKIRIYPNPAQSELNIEVPVAMKGVLSIQVTDASGRVVFSKMEEHVSGIYYQKILLSDYSSGIYYLKVSGSDSEQISSFLKK